MLHRRRKNATPVLGRVASTKASRAYLLLIIIHGNPLETPL